jgi:hypothetical protein
MHVAKSTELCYEAFLLPVFMVNLCDAHLEQAFRLLRHLVATWPDCLRSEGRERSDRPVVPWGESNFADSMETRLIGTYTDVHIN